MTNIIFSIIVALGMKVADSALGPTYYMITYQDGQREEVVVTKGDNICPHYCGINHAHKVNMCEGGDCDLVDKSFVISKQKTPNNTFSLHCKGKEIMLFQEINRNDKPKKKKNNSIELF